VDLVRIRTEFSRAREKFSHLELYPTSDGKVYVRVVLQPSGGSTYYVVSIRFPNTYPNEMPKVYIDKPTIRSEAPHQYREGHICYLLPSVWNPGRHHLEFVIGRTAKWLNKYQVWLKNMRWPGAGITH